MRYICLILVFVSGVAKAVMDTLQFHFSVSVFNGLNNQWCDPYLSWRNKYHSPLPDSFTDLWHLSQFFFLGTIFAAIIIYSPFVKWNSKSNWWTKALDFLLLRFVFGIGFGLFYEYFLIK